MSKERDKAAENAKIHGAKLSPYEQDIFGLGWEVRDAEVKKLKSQLETFRTFGDHVSADKIEKLRQAIKYVKQFDSILGDEIDELLFSKDKGGK